jgi:hypothetical protein
MSHPHDHYDGAEPIDHSHDHNHDHDHGDDLTPAIQNLLYQQIDTSKVTCLNEDTPNAGRDVLLKTYSQRLDPEPELRSDADEQLLLHVPYGFRVLSTKWQDSCCIAQKRSYRGVIRDHIRPSYLLSLHDPIIHP